MYGMAKTRYFGSSADVQKVLETASANIEIMVHLPEDIEQNSRGADIALERGFVPQQLASYP
jgi:hypothetical protein